MLGGGRGVDQLRLAGRGQVFLLACVVSYTARYRCFSDLLIEPCRIPDLLADLSVEFLALVELLLAESIGIRAERQATLLPVRQERRVVDVALRMKGLSQE